MTRPPVAWDPKNPPWTRAGTRSKRYRAGELATTEREQLVRLEIEHSRLRVEGDTRGMARTLKLIRAKERRIAELERVPE